MGRGLIIALGASLALNFFGAGFFLSSGLHMKAPPPGAGSTRGIDGTGGLARSARYLPDESRIAFRQEIRKGLPDMREQSEEVREQRKSLYSLLEAEEFDAAAIEVKLEELRSLRVAQHRAFDEAFVQALEVISRDDRQVLVDRAQAHRRERDRRRGHHGGRHDRDRD